MKALFRGRVHQTASPENPNPYAVSSEQAGVVRPDVGNDRNNAMVKTLEWGAVISLVGFMCYGFANNPNFLRYLRIEIETVCLLLVLSSPILLLLVLWYRKTRRPDSSARLRDSGLLVPCVSTAMLIAYRAYYFDWVGPATNSWVFYHLFCCFSVGFLWCVALALRAQFRRQPRTVALASIVAFSSLVTWLAVSEGRMGPTFGTLW